MTGVIVLVQYHTGSASGACGREWTREAARAPDGLAAAGPSCSRPCVRGVQFLLRVHIGVAATVKPVYAAAANERAAVDTRAEAAGTAVAARKTRTV